MIVRMHDAHAIDFEGLRILDYTAGSELSSSFAQIEVPPGVAHAQAWSKRSDKYYLVTKGAVQFRLDGHDVELSEGDFCLVPQGERFSYRNSTSETATLVLVHTPCFDVDSEVFVGEN